MTDSKPPFDPNQPFESTKPGFDENASFQSGEAGQEPSSLEALLRGGVNLFGAAPAVSGAIESLLTDKPYQQARAESHENFEKAKSAHPYMYGAGQLAGGILTAPLLPEAAGIMGAAKIGAGLGAATGLGESLSAGQGLGETAQNVAIGTGLGGATGGITGKLAKMLSPEALDQMAAERAVSASGGTKGQNKLLRKSPVQSNFGIPGEAKNRLEEQGANLLKKAPYEGAEEPIVTAFSNPEAILEKSYKLAEKSGQAVGQTLGELDKSFAQNSEIKKYFFNPAQAAKALEDLQKSTQFEPGVPFQLAKSKFNVIQAAIDDVNKYGKDPVPFSVAARIKKLFDEAAYNENGTPMEPIIVQARGIINGLIEGAADLVSNKIGNPELAKQYLQHKDFYRTAKDAIKMAEGKVAGGISGRDFGLTDYMAGMAGVAMHGTPTGLAAAGANKLIRTYGNSIGATAAKKTADVMRGINKAFTSVPEGMKSYGERLVASGSPTKAKLGSILTEASQRDDIGRNAVMFSVMQNDVYRAILNDVINEKHDERP